MLKIKCVDSLVNVHILASTSAPFTLTTVPNLALSHAKRITVLAIGLVRWYELIADWLSYGTEVYFLFYEDLVEDPLGEVRRLLDHLALPLDQDRLTCTARHLSGLIALCLFQFPSFIGLMAITSQIRGAVELQSC